MLYTASNIVST